MDTISWRPKTTQNTQEDTDSEYSMSKSGSCPPHNMFIPVSKRDDNATRYNFAPSILFRNRNTCHSIDAYMHKTHMCMRTKQTLNTHTLRHTQPKASTTISSEPYCGVGAFGFALIYCEEVPCQDMYASPCLSLFLPQTDLDRLSRGKYNQLLLLLPLGLRSPYAPSYEACQERKRNEKKIYLFLLEINLSWKAECCLL